MSIDGDAFNLRAPVLNPDLIGEERNVYSIRKTSHVNGQNHDLEDTLSTACFSVGGKSDFRLLRRLLTLGLSTSNLRYTSRF